MEPAAANRCSWLKCDVSSWDETEREMAVAEELNGPVNVAVANAGISLRHRIDEVTEQEARRVMEVNFLGVFGLWKAAAQRMHGRGGGVLLATASTNGQVGYPRYSDYNASKAAVLSLCQTFALEYAPGIRTATVSPGYVLTPMQAAEYTDEMIEGLNTRIPLRRHASPEEVAEVFFFLASPAAGYLTGQTITLDGGELAGGVASDFGIHAST